MNEQQIRDAIEIARLDIAEYVAIMELFKRVNVASDRQFQRRFNAFYKIGRRPEKWYQEYYHLMQNLKGTHPSFFQLLDYFCDHMARYEPSFASKLVATIDPHQPIWDRYVLQSIGLKAPQYSSPLKFGQAKSVYVGLQEWYTQMIPSADGQRMLAIFDSLIPQHNKLTSTRKIEFILWRTHETSDGQAEDDLEQV